MRSGWGRGIGQAEEKKEEEGQKEGEERDHGHDDRDIKSNDFLFYFHTPMSSSDHDEFDAYDFSEFTEEELRKADAPFSYRKRFSVTDLVSPIWCARVLSFPRHISDRVAGAKCSTSTVSMAIATNPCICAPPPSPQSRASIYASVNTSRTQTTAGSSVARHAFLSCPISRLSFQPVCPQGTPRRAVPRKDRRPRHLRGGTLRSSVRHFIPCMPLSHPVQSRAAHRWFHAARLRWHHGISQNTPFFFLLIRLSEGVARLHNHTRSCRSRHYCTRRSIPPRLLSLD